MTDEQTALARRAVACPKWRWMPGMLDDDGCTVCSASDDGYLLLAGSEGSTVGWWPVAERLPDLTDAATIGCLLALVRKAWEEPLLGVAFDFAGGDWLVRPWNRSLLWQGEGATEAEALVSALEAAP